MVNCGLQVSKYTFCTTGRNLTSDTNRMFRQLQEYYNLRVPQIFPTAHRQEVHVQVAQPCIQVLLNVRVEKSVPVQKDDKLVQLHNALTLTGRLFLQGLIGGRRNSRIGCIQILFQWLFLLLFLSRLCRIQGDIVSTKNGYLLPHSLSLIYGKVAFQTNTYQKWLPLLFLSHW